MTGSIEFNFYKFTDNTKYVKTKTIYPGCKTGIGSLGLAYLVQTNVGSSKNS